MAEKDKTPKEPAVEDIKFTEVKSEKFDPLNSEAMTDNLRTDQFAPPPPNSSSRPFEPIPEPRPSNPYQGGSSSFGGNTPPPRGASFQQQQEPINPDFNEMPDAEKDAAAEQAADMVIALYSGLKSSAAKLVIITERKLKKMEKEGLINLSIKLQRSPNDPTPTTILEIIQQFNKGVPEGYKVSQQFIDTARPVLIRIFKKKGIGLTDEQFLMFLIGQDAMQTLFHTINMYRQRNDVLNQLIEINNTLKGQGVTGTPPPPPPPQSQPAREPEETQNRNEGFASAEVKTEKDKTGQKPDLIISSGRKERKRRERKISK